jgi:hypothetical protein
MSNLRSARVGSDHHHIWKKEERRLSDGFSYYYMICRMCHEVKFPAFQLQCLQDYSKTHLFLFVEDWVLLLLYVGHRYIAGITHYQKMLFLIFHEFAPQHNIPTENPGFYGYKYGPYSDRIDAAIGFLIQYKYIATEGRKSSSKERFSITSDGETRGKEIFGKLSKEQQDALKSFRDYWDQKPTLAIIKYIYSKYKKFTKKSVILSRVFPGRKLYRRRG